MLKLDDTDRRILQLLQADASLATAEIAERVGLSVSPCWRRIRRLREAGAIIGSVTLLDPKALGLAVSAFAAVRLTRHTEENVAAFERFVADAPEVLECHAMSGEQDYMLRIVVTDIDAYQAFLSGRLLHLPFIASVNSSFVLKEVKRTTALPLPARDAS